MRPRRPECWSASGRMGRWRSNIAGRRCPGGRSPPLRRKKLNGGQRSRCAGESTFPHPTTRGGKATNSASELPCPSRRLRSFGLQPPLRLRLRRASLRLQPERKTTQQLTKFRPRKGDTSNELREGTFLKRFDTWQPRALTRHPPRASLALQACTPIAGRQESPAE